MLWTVLLGYDAAGIRPQAMADAAGAVERLAGLMFDLSGKVALVTGAARNLGKAMATALAEQGADTLLLDLDEVGVQQTAAELTALGRRAIGLKCDVGQPAQLSAAFDVLDQEFGAWRCLVYGRFFACQQAGRRMLKQQSGSIVNIGSLASVTALGRGHIAYSMAMGAVVAMTRELAVEWGNDGIRVNAILPAQVINDALRERMQRDPHLEQRFLSGIPRGRLGIPADIKGLSVLLASDEGSWISGALIPMDGGNLALNAGGSRRYAHECHF
jgi:NAD(P)-dependent dehydrogenase (short-subunit alcohol dehydrogenase family)